MTVLIRVGILTVSDRSAQGERPDASGPALAKAVIAYGWQVEWQHILPDDLKTLKKFLAQKSDDAQVDILLTTGGTGFAHRDVTPEATQAIVQRLAPGLAEAMRAESLKLTPHAMLSRGIAGIRGNTLIVNLPGSPKAATEHLAVIAPALPHAVQLLQANPQAENGHHIQSQPKKEYPNE